jgi:two-component system, OmpR family, sensor kinase
MGKLFWKFFFGFWLCLIAAAIATGSALYLMREKPASSDIAEGPRAQFMLETIQAVLEGKGPGALEELLTRNRQRTGLTVPVFAVSSEGKDILNRELPTNIAQRLEPLLQGRTGEQADGQADGESGILRVTALDNSQWLIFIPKPKKNQLIGPKQPKESLAEHAQDREFKGPRHASLEPPLPTIPGAGLVAAFLASVLFAGALAYTFSRPLNTLKHAFREAGKGRLGIRIATQGRKRNDEIGELLNGFDHMAEEIENRIDQQKALLHDVSHELRSPLARLNLAVGLARQNPAQLENSLQRIETEAERLDQLIGQLLNLSRLDSGQATPNLAAHNIVELLTAVVEDAQFEAGQDNKEVVFINHAKTFKLHCDPESLQGAFDNVLRNALKHTPAQGQVTVRCELHRQGLRIAIEDQGPGVPVELLPKLFTPFFKHGKHSGHGLGLAIARKSVQAVKGRLTAQNRAQGGFSVLIELPQPSP